MTFDHCLSKSKKLDFVCRHAYHELSEKDHMFLWVNENIIVVFQTLICLLVHVHVQYSFHVGNKSIRT
jgi:hypothetical protein